MSLQIWDTRGYSDQFDRLHCLAYRNTDCLVFLYSISDRKSYSNILEKWMPETDHYCPNVPRILLSTKIDLLEDKELLEKKKDENFVSTDEGMELQQKINFEFFLETSSKLHVNIDEILDAISRTIEKRNLSKIKKEKECTIS